MTDLRRPVDFAWLGALRIAMGGMLCISMIRLLAYGWWKTFFLNSFQFKYWGFSWVRTLPPAPLQALICVLAVLAVALAAGLFFRAAALLFLAGFVYLQLLDVTNYLNHYYLAALLVALLAVSPAGRAWSLDSWRKQDAVETVPAFWLYLFRFQVGVVYTFAGLAKAHGDWLFHAEPLGIWLSANTDLPILGPLLVHPWAAPLFSWCGFLFDTFIIWFLLWKRTRLFAYAAVVVFHVMTRLLFPIGMFPFIMIGSALVMFPPGWPRRLFRRPAVPLTTPRAVPAWGLAIAILYCLVQVVLPLRHWLYPGDVRWGEQGMRFSWRVMVREKNGSVTFEVKQLKTGKVSLISPRQYLTRLQEREMSTQPDLILQLAKHIEQEYQRRGLGPVEVRADAISSLNGRAAHPLIDPKVDLSKEKDTLLSWPWILPPPTEDPPHLRALLAHRS
ncbi:MAG TPA: HTTM domain-containing protein [Myxococcales bacterium]|nr:HTTM domain-containing protein [Myxococcales bacterium]